MSHVTDLKLNIKDLDALEKSLPDNMELRRNQTTYAWWGRFEGDSTPPEWMDPKDYGKCEHAIGFKGVKGQIGHDGNKWEIGLVRKPGQEGYELLADTFGSGSRLGAAIPKIRQEYAANVAEKTVLSKLANKGYKAVRENLPNGSIRIVVKKR